MKEFIVNNMMIWTLIGMIPWALIAGLVTSDINILAVLLVFQITGFILQISSFILDK